VQNYGEMKIMAIHKKVNAELAQLRKQKRELVKREKELIVERKLEKNIGKWKVIMDARTKMEEIIDSTDFGRRMGLHEIAKFPTFYIYQHPINKKLKTSNINAKWVQQYLGNIPPDSTGGMGGVEADLLDTARKSTLNTWKRLNNKKKRKAKIMADLGITGSGKEKAVGSIGAG